MASVKLMAGNLVIVTCERDSTGVPLRARLSPSNVPSERGKVHFSLAGTMIDGQSRGEVYGYMSPDDAFALAEQILRTARIARRTAR